MSLTIDETAAPLFLTVVIPTFNRVDSLKKTLDGLSRQTFPASRWEVVVVSDGSTDGTDAFLAEYAATAPFALRPIRQDNAGPSRARNRGIREATGTIVVFIDDDVEPVASFLAVHAGHHERDPKVVVIGPLARDPARRNAEPVWIGWEHAMLEKQYTAFRTGEWPSAGPNHFYSGNASVRRAFLDQVNGFDESFTRQEDVEIAYRLERECDVRFVFDPDACGVHRPLRTWSSWLKVPYAYGKLDVVRARRGDIGWDLVRHGYVARNPVTRLLARAVLNAPALSAPARALLRTGAMVAYRCRRDGLAYGALSVAYNVHYLEGAQAEMGGPSGTLGRVLKGANP